mmetsp:Transcript_37966/g.109212  ORF Transcript_37966/g.109212 Transcript_37966/m.109212 type:complete len:223 (+) Transcript_37966:1268-1936(+)
MLAVRLQAPGVCVPGLRRAGLVRAGRGARAQRLHGHAAVDARRRLPLALGRALLWRREAGAGREAGGEGHTKPVRRVHRLVAACVGPHLLQVLPRGDRQPYELRQQPHRGALRDDGGVHGEPDGHQEVHECPSQRHHVEVQQPRRRSGLQAALGKEGDARIQLQDGDDQVAVHFLLRQADDVSDVLAPQGGLHIPELQDLELVLLPHLPVELKVLPVVAPQP